MVGLFKAILSLIKGTSKLEKQKTDMFLPFWLFIVGIVCIVGSLFGMAYIIFWSFYVVGILVCSVFLILGMGAILCWANQKINILDESTFEYVTFLGNKKVYRFSDITGIKTNNDSQTLFVGDDKIHIESCAIMSQRLINKFNEALENQRRG
ncbi:MAG: hypothetical protein J6V36_04035 [Clostridia bacterium]|nr:hypothetical protein [Clostridia bacterium]